MARLELSEDVVVHQVSTPSLGDHSYVVSAGETAVVIDPQRDIERFVSLLDDSGLTPAAVLETHVHNDYVSGGSLLADGYGCRYRLPADTGASVRHQPIGQDGTVPLAGGWSVRALLTPGHTRHHTAYVVEGPEGPRAVLTGGSMLVGSVGRTDLLGPDLTDSLTRAQHRSVRRLASELEDPVVVAPTHGAGSFCATGPSSDSTSTIGAERTRNPALLTDDEDAFLSAQTSGYGMYPSYYRHMAPINRAGAEPIPPPPPNLGPDALDATDAAVIDLRRPADFAAGHVPGSINIPYGPTAATYAAWAGEWNTPALLIGPSPRITERMRIDMARIGYDAVVGTVTDGLAAWLEAGNDPATSRLATFDELERERPDQILDVRDPIEGDGLPEARNVHVSKILEAEVGDGTPWVYCATGYRSTIAASILETRGIPAVTVLDDLGHYRPS